MSPPPVVSDVLVSPCVSGNAVIRQGLAALGLDDADEAIEPVRRRPAGKPTEAEIRAHRVSHLPFRDWCPECVAGRAKDWPHKSIKEKVLEVPEVHFDYCFPRDGPGEDYSVVLVGKDRESKMIMAHVVPFKGADTEWVCEQIVRDLRKWGIHGEVKLFSDQEPAIHDVLVQVAKYRGAARTTVCHSAVGDSAGNGIAERAVQSVEEMVRVHKLALEGRLQQRLPVRHAVFAWLVEHAADVLNRYCVGRDGRTPFHRLRGRHCESHMAEFGALVMFRVAGKVHGGNMQERWFTGVWLGKQLSSEEHLVMKADGLVVRARAIREMSGELKWEDVDKLQSTPHDPTGTLRSGDRDSRKQPEAKEQEEEDRRPRAVRITREMVMKFGGTKGCMKCRAFTTGEGGYENYGHNPECRRRIEELMKTDKEFQEQLEKADNRRMKHIADRMAKQDKEEKEALQRAELKQPKTVLEPAAAAAPVAAAASAAASSSHAEDVAANAESLEDGDADMGIPAAGDGQAKRNREEEDEEQQEARRPRLNAVLAEHVTFDVCEIFSRRRVCKVAADMGLSAGYSLDIREVDDVTGRKWDFLNQRCRGELWQLLEVRPCQLLVLSPPCVIFSQLQQLRQSPMSAAERENGMEMLRVAMTACRRQWKAGRWFLFEHPATATSWQEKCVTEILALEGVRVVTLDQCQYGLTSRDAEGGCGPARKRTKFMTNMVCAEEVLSRRCPGLHQHVHLISGKAKAAEEYPTGLCQAIVEAYAIETKAKFHKAEVLGMEEDEKPWWQQEWELEEQWDENTGEQLNPAKVKEGRRKELEHFEQRGVWEVVPRTEDMKVLRTRWVQTNKGPDVRCRLVAQEFASGDPREDLFSGTPPLFAARLVTSLVASRPKHDWALLALDVSCAFLYAKAKRELYVELPVEHPRSQGGAHVGRLLKAMYGTRDAPQRWFEELAKTLKEIGFVSSKLHPGVYHHPGRDVYVVAHVDDLLCGGPMAELLKVRQQLQQKYDVKGTTLSAVGDSVNFLGREIRWTNDGIMWTHGSKHVDRLLQDWGMSECKGLSTPTAAVKDISSSSSEEGEMRKEDATRFRRAVARLNYLTQDRADLGYATNVLSRTMSNPRVGDEVVLKRVLRYLKLHPVCSILHRWQEPPAQITVLTDSDWAGCHETRRSVSGIAVMHGRHMLSTHSRLQKSVALSSGEAELNAQVSGIIEALGVVHLLFEMHRPMKLVSRCDSSAARGILQRVGVGKLKHLEVKILWVQELVQAERVYITRVRREANASDLMTHGCTVADMFRHLSGLDIHLRPASSTRVQTAAEGGC